MPIALPANIQVSAANVNTSGTANTQVATTLITAPGAGNRSRIFALSLGFALSTFTGTKLIGLFGTTGGLYRATLNCSLGQPSAWQEFPGGMPTTPNTAYQVTHSCDVATQSIYAIVYYVNEAS